LYGTGTFLFQREGRERKREREKERERDKPINREKEREIKREKKSESRREIRRREKEREGERESSWRGVNIVATNVTAANVLNPGPGVTFSSTRHDR